MSNEQQQSLESIKEIQRMMQQSSRFVSLSGLSGVSVGVCALVASFFGIRVIQNSSAEVHKIRRDLYELTNERLSIKDYMGSSLFQIAAITLALSLFFAFLFTYLKSKKNNTPIWSSVSIRLTTNILIPLIVGGIFILKLIENKSWGLIAPGCLLFYGLALVNGSKYTLGEIRYLGYAQLILGIINLFFVGYGIYFWAIGFGLLHIIYGVYMWYKYERVQ